MSFSADLKKNKTNKKKRSITQVLNECSPGVTFLWDSQS